MQSELYPLAARALGSGVAMGVAEMGSFVVGLTFLPLMEELSPAWTLKGFAGVCALGLLGVWAIYPETARLTLEEAGKVLERSWAVR
jgi:SP family myo-inositol transporter-like MFS transporter 13